MGYHRGKLHLTVLTLGMYFVLLPLDFIGVGSFGSVLRVYVLIPMACAVIQGGWRQLRKSRILLILLLLTVWIGFSVLYSIQIDVSIGAYQSLLMNLVFLVVMGGTNRFQKEDYDFLQKCLIAGSWLAVGTMLALGTYSADGRLTLVVGENVQDANYINGYILFAFCYHLTQFLERNRWIHLFLTGGVFAVVILTGSRGALVAYLVAVLIAVLGSVKNSKHPLRTVCVVVMLVVGAGVLFGSMMSRMESSLAARFTLSYLMEKGTTGRTKIWENLLTKYRSASLFRQIFGHGYGTARLLNTVGGSLNGLVAHNLYIEDLMSIGLVGVLLRMLLLGDCVKKAIGNSWMLCVLGAFLTMTLSLSLTNYKPIWAIVMMLLIQIEYTKHTDH